MNIAKISCINYRPNVNFKGQNPEHKSESKDTIAKFDLPEPSKYEYAPLYTDPKKADMLQKEYRSKLSKVCFDTDGRLNPVIKKKLDESFFVFDMPDGSSQVMTIKEAIKAYVKPSRPIDAELYHATFVREDAENIIKKGFDPQKIKRTEFGPGFYFTPSEGDAMNYGSAKVKARIKGNCGHINGKFYEKINNYKVQEGVKNFVGMKSVGYPTQDIEREVARTIINEYARNVIYQELGYDCAYGAGGGKACFVVFNPNSISDIEMF